MTDSDRPKDIPTPESEAIESPFDDLGVSGLLTRSDRKLLLDKKSYDDPVEERKARQRLRERVWNGLKDFQLLVRHLDQRDRVQIFGDVTAQVPDDVHRDDEIDGMIATVAFLYAAAHNAGIPFDTVIEHAVNEAKNVALANPFLVKDIEVQITEITDINLDTIVEKIDAGDELSRSERRSIKATLFSTLDEFVEMTDHIDLPREEYYESGKTLSVGESLILFGRILQEPTTLQPEIDGEILHEQVRQEFGLDQFLLGLS